MRNLHARLQHLKHLEHLERRHVAEATCRCWTVVQDEDEAPQICPHGRPWAGVIRIVHEERGPAQS